MLPPKTDPVWRRILDIKNKIELKNISAAMMLTRMKIRIQSDPSEQNVQKSVNEMYDFFTKYVGILADDIKTISR